MLTCLQEQVIHYDLVLMLGCCSWRTLLNVRGVRGVHVGFILFIFTFTTQSSVERTLVFTVLLHPKHGERSFFPFTTLLKSLDSIFSCEFTESSRKWEGSSRQTELQLLPRSSSWPASLCCSGLSPHTQRKLFPLSLHGQHPQNLHALEYAYLSPRERRSFLSLWPEICLLNILFFCQKTDLFSDIWQWKILFFKKKKLISTHSHSHKFLTVLLLSLLFNQTGIKLPIGCQQFNLERLKKAKINSLPMSLYQAGKHLEDLDLLWVSNGSPLIGNLWAL